MYFAPLLDLNLLSIYSISWRKKQYKIQPIKCHRYTGSYHQLLFLKLIKKKTQDILRKNINSFHCFIIHVKIKSIVFYHELQWKNHRNVSPLDHPACPKTQCWLTRRVTQQLRMTQAQLWRRRNQQVVSPVEIQFKVFISN